VDVYPRRRHLLIPQDACAVVLQEAAVLAIHPADPLLKNTQSVLGVK
jgi:hypothetical protein